MKSERLLTTGEVAAHCRVSYETVNNWIKSGKLVAYVTPGKHHRIPIDGFRDFLQQHNWPPFDEVPAPKPRVLVVDDDQRVLKSVLRNLTNSGAYELASATDGFDAGLQIAKFKPDLIILDLMMPRVNGFELCQKIKSSPETRRIGVLVITGHNSEENMQQALAAGADAYLTKPFTTKALQKTLQELWTEVGKSGKASRA
ncbi:MAG: response regulator [Candidatus Latescibacteria bacterium]|nr:response regulator [Candidatus Latescibacterota bacterium]